MFYFIEYHLTCALFKSCNSLKVFLEKGQKHIKREKLYLKFSFLKHRNTAYAFYYFDNLRSKGVYLYICYPTFTPLLAPCALLKQC